MTSLQHMTTAGMTHNAQLLAQQDVFKAATNINGADEIVFRYPVMYEDGFEFDEDRRLPSAYTARSHRGCVPTSSSNKHLQLAAQARNIMRSTRGAQAQARSALTWGSPLRMPPRCSMHNHRCQLRLLMHKISSLSAADGDIHIWIDGNETVTLRNAAPDVLWRTIDQVLFKDRKAWFADVFGAIDQS
ncbi:hypothetical protein M0805_005886 [Coniferiporia weirii]|nr:hypothetical protein M0805_005886 [Coniferiporia weirii]